MTTSNLTEDLNGEKIQKKGGGSALAASVRGSSVHESYRVFRNKSGFPKMMSRHPRDN